MWIKQNCEDVIKEAREVGNRFESDLKEVVEYFIEDLNTFLPDLKNNREERNINLLFKCLEKDEYLLILSNRKLTTLLFTYMFKKQLSNNFHNWNDTEIRKLLIDVIKEKINFELTKEEEIKFQEYFNRDFSEVKNHLEKTITSVGEWLSFNTINRFIASIKAKNIIEIIAISFFVMFLNSDAVRASIPTEGFFMYFIKIINFLATVSSMILFALLNFKILAMKDNMDKDIFLIIKDFKEIKRLNDTEKFFLKEFNQLFIKTKLPNLPFEVFKENRKEMAKKMCDKLIITGDFEVLQKVISQKDTSGWREFNKNIELLTL
jgi:hypothetical protein